MGIVSQVQVFDDPKVCQSAGAVAIDKHIRRLEVAVDKALGVDSGQGPAEIDQDLFGSLPANHGIHGAKRPNELVQIGSVYILHRDEWMAEEVAVSFHAHHVGVVDSRQRTKLAMKALEAVLDTTFRNTFSATR